MNVELQMSTVSILSCCVIMPSVITLNVVELNVILLIVVAPRRGLNGLEAIEKNMGTRQHWNGLFKRLLIFGSKNIWPKDVLTTGSMIDTLMALSRDY
jgi:hypothetical protein